MQTKQEMNQTALPAQFQDYLSYLFAVRGVSARTLEAYKRDLGIFVRYCKSHDIQPERAHAQELQDFMGDCGTTNLASVSINRLLSSVRGFYRWFQRFGYRKDDPSLLLSNLKTPQRLPAFLWEREMAYFADLPHRANILWPLRDRALIVTMYSGGLRISELVSLSLKVLEKDLSGARVLGKGNKERYVFFSNEARDALTAYLPARSRRISTEAPTEQLFINFKGKGLSVSGVRWIITQYAKCSHLEKPIHPHALRHSFATHLINAGCDIRVVQELLGHTSISSTQGYTHVDMERLKQVYARSHPHGTARIQGSQEQKPEQRNEI